MLLVVTIQSGEIEILSWRARAFCVSEVPADLVGKHDCESRQNFHADEIRTTNAGRHETSRDGS